MRLSLPRFVSPLVASALLCVATLAAAQQLTGKEPPVDAAVVGSAPAVLDLPQMGEPADAAMSPAQEAAIGARVVAELYQYEYMLEDAQLTEYLSALGWRLVAASQQKPPRLNVFMVRDPRINAFALPGGHLGFNAGLLMAAQTESEVAGVMGHELAHVTQRHIARSQDSGGGLGAIATWAAVLAAIIAGSADPDVVLAALAVGQGVSYQKQVNFTRANELEADRIGIQTMADAGFDPDGMSAFFQRLEQQSRLYGTGMPDILRTHPMNTVRVSEARSRASALKKGSYRESPEFALMKARTQVLTSTRPSESIEAFSAELKNGHDTAANRYGLAIALHQMGQNDRAIATLKPAYDKDSKQVNLALLMAELQLAAGRKGEAMSLYASIYNNYPHYTPAILEYARALIDTGKADQARQLLLTSEQDLGTRLETYRLLADAAHETKQDAEASYQMANYLYYRGDAGGALAQLDAGLRLSELAPSDRARLAARRAEVREALPRNFDPYADQRRR